MGENRFWEPAPAEGGEGSAQCSGGTQARESSGLLVPLALCDFGRMASLCWTSVPCLVAWEAGAGRVLFSSAERLPACGSSWTEAVLLRPLEELCTEVGVLGSAGICGDSGWEAPVRPFACHWASRQLCFLELSRGHSCEGRGPESPSLSR